MTDTLLTIAALAFIPLGYALGGAIHRYFSPAPVEQCCATCRLCTIDSDHQEWRCDWQLSTAKTGARPMWWWTHGSGRSRIQPALHGANCETWEEDV